MQGLLDNGALSVLNGRSWLAALLRQLAQRCCPCPCPCPICQVWSLNHASSVEPQVMGWSEGNSGNNLDFS